MLQEEMMGNNMYYHHPPAEQQQTGVQLGTAISGAGSGGIGNAMEHATLGLGGSFKKTVPESPPRLDAFKMIKVIGKGSFGTLIVLM
jgi:hypothetical protein